MKYSAKTILTAAFAVFLTASAIFAVPARREPIDFELPDGTTLSIRLRGDEFVSWRTTLDGFTLLFNEEGFLEYAVSDENGDLKLSGIRANDENRRSAQEINFLKTLERDLRFSRSQLNEKLHRIGRGSRGSGGGPDGFVTSGNVRVPVILIGFQGRQFTKTKAEFEQLLNGVNYTDNGRIPGSLRDYFRDASSGRLNLQFDLFGPYNLPNPVSHYADECSPSGDPRLMVRAAIDSAVVRGGANFANYAPDNFSTVPTVHIIFAGYCASESGNVCHIWSHKSSINTVMQNSKAISVYSLSPELRGSSGSNIAGITTMAHELGHALLGLPDFYDTDYETSGEAVDIDRWCLMAGAHNRDFPQFLSAHPRVTVGWAQEILLESAQDITLQNPNLASDAVVYRINTTTPNEYFLLENRQKTGWDSSIPSSGMLIYHVDRNNIGWTENAVNSVANRRGYYVKQAGCAQINGCSDRANDPWPRGNFDSFTDVSTPNAKSWAGINTNTPISEIRRNDALGTVSFRFLGFSDNNTSVRSLQRIENYGIVLENAVVSDAAKISVITPEPAQITLKILDNLGNIVFETVGANHHLPTRGGGTAQGGLSAQGQGGLLTQDGGTIRANNDFPLQGIVWNLSNKAGRFVGNGTYLIVVEARSASGKVYLYQARIGVNR